MKLTVKVPATTANLGPGFDCLGLALDWWNTLTVEPAAALDVRLRGDSEGLPADASNMTIENMQLVFKHIGKPMPPVCVTMTNRIPIGRGLGSSAAALIGGLVAANALAGEPLSKQDLLELATKCEGHPDNASAALYGGFTLSATDNGQVTCVAVEPPAAWRAVLFIHDHALSTKFARKILPNRVSRADAVFNIGRAALLTYAFLSGDPAVLEVATEDRLHQPYRKELVAGMSELLQAAREAGATGTALSGAGPSLLAFAPSARVAGKVRDAYTATAEKIKVRGDVYILKLSPTGASVATS